MTLEEIEIFLAILQKRNLSKAAASLYMSQSTLSHRLSAMEKELNVTLFERKKGQRVLELTPHGRDFVDIAERWMALWKEAQSLHLGHGNQVLYIGAVASLHQYLFPSLWRKINSSEEPKIRLMVKSLPSSSLYPALENHEIDAGFSVLPSVYSSINNRAVLREENVMVRYSEEPSSMGSFGETIHPHDLDPNQELLFQYHPDYAQWHNHWFGSFSLPQMGVGDGYLLEQLLDQPDFWAIVPLSMGIAMQRNSSVVLHRLSNPPSDRICYLLTHRVLRPGKERCMDLMYFLLEEFLVEGEQKEYFKRM